MTALRDYFTGTEGGTVQIPEHAPRRNTSDLWKGVPGLDPQAPVANPGAAARITAMRCALWVFGADAATKPLVGQSITGKWLTWLLDAGPDITEAWIRRQALRDACEWVIVNGMATWTDRDVLNLADGIYDASVPRRR